MSPISTSGWTPLPARSNRFRGRRRATMRRAASAPRRAWRRAAIERRHLAARCAALADLKSAGGAKRQQQDKQRQAEMVERAAAQIYRPSPPLSPASFNSAIAEISARQNELDNSVPRQVPRNAPRRARLRRPRRLCRHLRRPPRCRRRAGFLPRSSAICSRSPARSRRCSVPTGSSNRSRRSAANWPKFAPPSPKRCRAARSNRSRAKSARCRAGSTTPATAAATARQLAGIERALNRIREALRSLTPAEQLAGYDDAIRNLGAKLDLILRANDDPLDRASARKRDRGTSLDHFQCRLQ